VPRLQLRRASYWLEAQPGRLLFVAGPVLAVLGSDELSIGLPFRELAFEVGERTHTLAPVAVL